MSPHVDVEDGFVLLWERKYLVLKVGSMNIDIHQKLTDYSALEYISQASLFFLFIYFTAKQLFKPHLFCFLGVFAYGLQRWGMHSYHYP